MSNKSQFLKFDNGMIVDLENLISFKEDSREMDSVVKSGKYIPQMYGLKSIAKTVEQNTYHKVCLETVAVDTSANGFEIKTYDPKENDESDTQVAIYDFFEGLNVEEVAYEFAFEYRLYGQVWLEILKDKYDGKGAVKGLNVLQGKYMYKTFDDRVYISVVNGKSVYYKKFGNDDIDVNMKNGEIKLRGNVPESERASEVYFLKSYNPNSMNYGLPIAVNIMTSIIGDLKRGENNMNFFLRGGIPKYLITITGNFETMINKAEYEADPENVVPVYIEDWLEDQMRVIESQNNPNGALVLTMQNNGMETPVDVQFQQISSNSGEASHREYRKDNRDEILAAHQVPVYRLGIAETGSLGQTNIIEQNKTYNRKVIKPIQKMFERVMNKILEHQFGKTIASKYRFDFNEIDIEDNLIKVETKLKENEFLLKEYQAGVITLEMYLEQTGRDISDFESSLEETDAIKNELQKILNESNGILT